MNDDVVVFKITFALWDFIKNGARTDEEHHQNKKKNVFFMQIQHH